MIRLTTTAACQQCDWTGDTHTAAAKHTKDTEHGCVVRSAPEETA